MCIALLGCSRNAPVLTESSLAAELAVSETVLRFEWAKRSQEDNEDVKGFYLAMRGEDFPDSFYNRFPDNVPPVQKFSELPMPLEEIRTHLWTAYWVWGFESPKQIDANTFVVRAGYRCGRNCANSCDYTVVHEADGRLAVSQVSGCVE